VGFAERERERKRERIGSCQPRTDSCEQFGHEGIHSFIMMELHGELLVGRMMVRQAIMDRFHRKEYHHGLLTGGSSFSDFQLISIEKRPTQDFAPPIN